MNNGRIMIVKVAYRPRETLWTIENFVWTRVFSCLSTSEVKLSAIISITITGSRSLPYTPPAPATEDVRKKHPGAV